MAAAATDQSWAILRLCDSSSRQHRQISTTKDTKEIKLVNSKYNFGRYEECDFSFTDNKYLSGVHCSIEYDADKKQAWFIDSSTNGSLINLKLKIHKTKYLLANKDKICLVYRKSEPEKNITYEFQYAKRRQSFFETTLSYEMEMPADAEEVEEEEVKESCSSRRGLIDYRLDEQKVRALEQLEQEIRKENEAAAKASTAATHHKPDDAAVFKVPDLPPLKTTTTSSDQQRLVKSSSSSSSTKKPALLHQASSRQLKKQRSIDEDERTDVGKHKAESDEDEDKSAKKAKLDQDEPKTSKPQPYKDDTVEEKVPQTPTPTSNTQTDKDDDVSTKPETKPNGGDSKRKFDGFEDSLICSICNDIMHDCVSLQPCLHSYCSGCYSEWMVMSDDCPICRVKVTRISKSHMLNNLIETFLKNNPDMRRPEAEIHELDSKNKITHDMLYPAKKERKKNDDYEFHTDSEEEEQDDDDERAYGSDEEDDDYYYDGAGGAAFPVPAAPFYFNAPAGLPVLNMAAAAAYTQPFRFTCRQCPQNRLAHAGMVAPDHVCTATQNHLLCQCCLEAMPDRSNDRARDPVTIPKQNCSMCFKAFCDLYWGCRKGGCKRCLFKFSEMRVDADCLSLLINGNNYESQLFSDWLTRKNKTVEQLFAECVQKMRSGAYKAGTLRPAETLDRIVCRGCGLSLFSELAYQYRVDIDNSEFSNNGTRRPDCHWGKNCRTQKHNLDHARRYNHICEQIKR